MWICSFGVPECPICKRSRIENEAREKEQARADRKAQIMRRLQDAIISGRVKPKMKGGKIALEGLTMQERAEIAASDDCIVDVLQKEGTPLVRAKLSIGPQQQRAQIRR